MLYPAELPGRFFVYRKKAMTRNSTLIQVFAKNPVPGKVKTRLVPLLGEKKACELHKELVASVMKRLEGLGRMVQIWADEEPISPFFDQFKIEKRLQNGRGIIISTAVIQLVLYAFFNFISKPIHVSMIIELLIQLFFLYIVASSFRIATVFGSFPSDPR